MSFRLKMALVIALVMAVMGGSTAFVATSLLLSRGDIVHATELTDVVDGPALELLTAIEDISTDIIEVQQYFSDAAAKEVVSGEPLDRANHHRDRFTAALAQLRQSVRSPDVAGVLPLADSLQASWAPYWDTGIAMVKAYADSGPPGGEQAMADFDAKADALLVLADRVEKIAVAGMSVRLHELKKAERSVDEGNLVLVRFLAVATAIGFILVVGGVTYLYRMVSGSFADLEHDIEHIRGGGSLDGTRLSPHRADEFGRVAGKLHEIVINRGQLQVIADEQMKRSQNAERERYSTQRTMLRSLVEAAMLGNEAMVILSRMKQEIELSVREVQSMASAVDSMREAVGTISEDSSQAATFAGDAGAAADHGLNASHGTLAAFARIVDAVASAGSKVQALAHASA